MWRSLPLLGLLLFAACDRPSETDCRKAVDNLAKLNDPEGTGIGPDPEAFIRKCRATGKKETVACLQKATTIAEAQACVPAKKK